MTELNTMLEEAFSFIKSSQAHRNESQKEMYLIESKIDNLQRITNPVNPKQTKRDLDKANETKMMLNHALKLTEVDENENPASYGSNQLTVRRALSNA